MHEILSLRDVFNNIDFPEYVGTKYSIYTKSSIMGKLVRNVFEYFSPCYFHEKRMAFYDNLLDSLPLDCYLRGFWQSEKYFSHISDTILMNFHFKPFQDNRNLRLADELRRYNSISIHVRKGKDYMAEVDRTDGVCDVEYYNLAITYMKEHVVNPKFYIFTDNPHWVSKNIKAIDYELIDWNPIVGKNNYLDLQLMSLSKHNIIANSSYSWWAAWLNSNSYKMVIAPKLWFNSKSKRDNPLDLIPESWISL